MTTGKLVSVLSAQQHTIRIQWEQCLHVHVFVMFNSFVTMTVVEFGMVLPHFVRETAICTAAPVTVESIQARRLP